VRLGIRTIVWLGACAAAIAATVGHFAIDIVGDYALPHDTYDDVGHSSRELLTGIAIAVAVALTLRGLRACCEIAAASRFRLPSTTSRPYERLGFILGTIATTSLLVPAMEWLDGRLAGAPVTGLADAFGGSLRLGLGTTVVCAALVAIVIYSFASWLISRRDVIVTLIETILRRYNGEERPRGQILDRVVRTTRRRRLTHALTLCKRGPPRGALHRHHTCYVFFKGDPRETRSFTRVTSRHCARDRVVLCRLSDGGTTYTDRVR